MMELGEFMMLSSEMKNKEILLSVLLIIQPIWSDNLVTLYLSASDLKHDGVG
jgi:hypothetical protein